MHELDSMKLANQILESFAGRPKPSSATLALVPNTCEYEDAKFFEGKDWRDVDIESLKEHSDAVYGFAPEAFCYYLPGVMVASIKASNARLSVIDALIGSLDRSPNPDYWDEFFVARWPLLNEREVRAVQQWVLWLLEADPVYFESDALGRAMDTLDLLIKTK